MNNKVVKLVTFVKELKGFDIVNEIDGNYMNMGATIIDGVLQAGINYKSTVKPRVESFLAKYPNSVTTTQFIDIFERETVSKLINWKSSAKTERIEVLSRFLQERCIETTEEFGVWLSKESNITEIKKLSGIKCKTADYFKILTGHQTNAVDRHLIGFIKQSGTDVTGYKEAQTIISLAALKLNIEESLFDHSIWKYMSKA